jgi:hypothetical protein
MMMDHVKKVLSDPKKYHPAYNERDGYEIAGFAWFQGYNDIIDKRVYPNRNQPGGYDLYTELFGHLIRDIRAELNAPKMPAAIGVVGFGGELTAEIEESRPRQLQWVHTHFRQAQAKIATIPEFKGNVVAVETAPFWDPQLDVIAGKIQAAKKYVQKLREEKKSAGEKLDSKEALEAKLDELLTDEEKKISKVGISHANFHYHGSAKIYGKIGRGLAEGLAQIMEK